MDIIFLLPTTEDLVDDWREHQVNGVIAEQPEGCGCATEYKPSMEYPGMFELKVTGVPEALEEFISGYGREPDIVDGFAMTPLAENKRTEKIQ